MPKPTWIKKKEKTFNLLEPNISPIPNDFSLENCPCNRAKQEYNPNCPLLNKLDIPEEYQPAYQELFHVFAEPQLVKLIATDRILGKTTNKGLEILVKVALAIENNQPLPQFIWLRRDYADNVQKSMINFRKLTTLFCKYWKGKPFTEKDFDAIYRGVEYQNKVIIFFYDLFSPDDSRGAITGNVEEIIFDECLPIELDKYQPEEEERFNELLSGAYRTNQENPTKITFLCNPYDRFFYGFNNWHKDLEQWAIAYQKEKPSEFTIKKIKKFEDGDELIYLRKFPEKRKLLSKFKSIDQQVWDKRFFVPKEDMNMIDKPKKYYTHYLLFNRIVCAGIPNKNFKFFYTPLANEKLPSDLEAWIFTNEEYRTCPSNLNKSWKNPKEKSYDFARSLSSQELFFSDFEARSRILDFINQHKYPYQYNKKPFQTLNIKCK